MSFENLEQPQQAKTLAAEAAELAQALSDLNVTFQRVVNHGEDLSLVEKYFRELESSTLRHEERLQYKVEEARNVILDRTKVYHQKNAYLLSIPSEDRLMILYHTLQDQDCNVRLYTAEFISSNQDPDSLKLLLKFGIRDPDRSVCLTAVGALKGTSDPECLKTLREGLNDPDVSVREASAWSLLRTKDPECLKALCEIGLRDEHLRVKEASASALTDTSDPACLSALCEFGLKSKNRSVRIASIQALENTKDQDCIKAMIHIARNDEYDQVIEFARHALRPREYTPLALFKWVRQVGVRMALSYLF